MKFQTHNDAEIDIFNTSWHYATIQATRADLTKAFGQPMLGGDKVQYEWNLKFEDGTICTIYDWKEPEFSDTAVIAWHIGNEDGTSTGRVTSLVHNAFREAHGLSARSAA